MVNLPQYKPDEPRKSAGGGCGDSCGAGLEKIYPSTAVRYGAVRHIGEFEYQPGTIFKCGAQVVIKTERGIELGQQVSLTCHGCEKSVNREQIKKYIENSGAEFYRLGSGRILREATSQDLDENQRLNGRVKEDVEHCALLAAQLELDLKIITAEHLLGGERIIFYFRSDQRVDFRQLVKELARHHQTRIQMLQVGPRDEAKLVADYEICGRECCCKNFLKKLRPVGMKMAKIQKSTLDPSQVLGRCGRLRCCLRYEHESYEELMAKLPPIGGRVGTEFGPATVIDRQILTQLVLVRTDNEREVTIPLEELKPYSGPPVELPPPPVQRTEDTPPPRRRFDRDDPAGDMDFDKTGSEETEGSPPSPSRPPRPFRPPPRPRPDATNGGPAPNPPDQRHGRRRRRRGRPDGPPPGGADAAP